MPQHTTHSGTENHRTALSLSGGGFRASLLHLGTLRRLNEMGALSRIDTICSVSGGSVTNAALLVAWPRLKKDERGVFTNFEEEVEVPVRAFCGYDHRTPALLTERVTASGVWDSVTWNYSPTIRFAERVRAHLVGDFSLADLRDVYESGGPAFLFASSSLQTGTTFTFGRTGFGDKYIGHYPELAWPVALAVAASAAYPAAFAPVELFLNPDRFVDLWADSRPYDVHLEGDVSAFRKRVILTDGGVYDNLALEPVWEDHHRLLVSDGGTAFDRRANTSSRTLGGLWRSIDIMDCQVTTVRKRWLLHSLTQPKGNPERAGAYWGTAITPENYRHHTATPMYSYEVRKQIRKIRTDLNAFSAEEQGILINFGWSLADLSTRSYLADFVSPVEDGQVPFPDLMGPDKEPAVLAALTQSDRKVGVRASAHRTPVSLPLPDHSGTEKIGKLTRIHQRSEAQHLSPDLLHARSVEAVRRSTLAGTITGFVPIPVLDTVAIGAVQLAMIRDICEIHGHAWEEEYASHQLAAVVAGIGGSLGLRTGLRALIRFTPLAPLAWATRAAASGTSTWIIGMTFAHHLAAGLTLRDPIAIDPKRLEALKAAAPSF